jgi:uncharacterized protein YraI
MTILERVLLVIGIAVGAIASQQATASASERATVTANVNLRAGPGSKHKSLGVVPAGDPVTVFSCRTGFDWCNVDHRGKRGYLSGRYLSYPTQGEYYGEAFSDVGIYLGVPLFWDDYPIYGPPGYRPPGYRPPSDRPPNWRPPGERPPRPSHPVAHPPRPSHPAYRPPSYQRPSVGRGNFDGGRGGFGGGRGGGGRGGGRR